MVHEDDLVDAGKPIQLVEAKPFTVWFLLLQRNVQLGLLVLVLAVIGGVVGPVCVWGARLMWGVLGDVLCTSASKQ
jgi:hypothetical protein